MSGDIAGDGGEPGSIVVRNTREDKGLPNRKYLPPFLVLRGYDLALRLSKKVELRLLFDL
jgi:hypothetical protein